MEWDKWLELLKAALDDLMMDSEETGSSECFASMSVLLEAVTIAEEVAKGGNCLTDVMLSWTGQTN